MKKMMKLKFQAINVKNVDESPFLRIFPVLMSSMMWMMLRSNVNAAVKKSVLVRRYLNNLILFRQRSRSFAIYVQSTPVKIVKVLKAMLPQLLLHGCPNRLSPNALELQG